jgi:hypothetical protein
MYQLINDDLPAETQHRFSKQDREKRTRIEEENRGRRGKRRQGSERRHLNGFR